MTEANATTTTATAEAPRPRPVRRRIKEDLPPETFESSPWRALWVVPIASLNVALTAWIILAQPAWWLALPAALVLANGYAQLGFLAHEAMHGAMMKSKALQTLMGYFGFAPFLVSPTLWRVWHNRVHHANTNYGDRDPDSFGTLKRYDRVPSTRFVTRLAPGSGRWYSYLFLFYWFTFHGQVVLWIQTKFMRAFEGFRGLQRGRAIAETFLFAGLWAALAWAAGPWGTLWIMVVPMALANFVVMSYIATNHFLRPQGNGKEPLDDSMSVNTLKIVDKLHFNFSHHIEHHLFPRMSPKHAPKVRQWLKENEGDRYVSPPHWKAVAMLYQTPRVYLDANTLIDPDDRHTVEIEQVEAKLGFDPVTMAA